MVALIQRNLEEEGAYEAIALHCIIYQKAQNFENVMSVVVKCTK